VVAVALLLLAVACGPGGVHKESGGSGEKTPGQTRQEASAQPSDGRPNIVFVLTDDMDERLLEKMPSVQRRVAGMGVTFENAFVTYSLCCPSRASILRGQYAHNHTIASNSLPDGGALRFRELGLDGSTVATWLEDSGYRTALVGKYLNNTDGPYVPPGWDEWHAMNDSASEHILNDDGDVRTYPARRDTTDVFRERAMSFLRRATDRDSDPPFMLWIGTWAPHLPARYPDRYVDLYRNAKLPRPPSFNEADVSDKPRWVRDLPRLSRREIQKLQAEQRNRMRSLKGVDDMVADILDLLRERGELGNTYVVFTSDNGLLRGEHRLQRKSTPYEEAAGVPLVIRGPGVPRGTVRSQLVANNDFAPTFAAWAGVHAPDFVDGRSLTPLLRREPPDHWRTALLNEWYPEKRLNIPYYWAIRTPSYAYVEWESGERELYDLRTDPYELRNLQGSAPPSLLKTLHARLQALRACTGAACREAEGPG
jgi:N-acetylglucosamine-6-sulfatase